MKDLKRLAATAELLNHPSGYLILRLQDADVDGGAFGLVPRIDDSNVYLPGPDASGYRLAITGDSPEVLERAGKALLTLARSQRKAAGEDVGTDGED